MGSRSHGSLSETTTSRLNSRRSYTVYLLGISSPAYAIFRANQHLTPALGDLANRRHAPYSATATLPSSTRDHVAGTSANTYSQSLTRPRQLSWSDDDTIAASAFVDFPQQVTPSFHAGQSRRLRPRARTTPTRRGDTITVAAEFTAAVTATGMATTITLRVGGGDAVNLKPANYASGSGTTTLRFAYVVQMDDEDTNGIYLEADELELNGGTIKGVSDGLDATLTYTRPAQQDDHKVDGVRPTPTAAAVPQNGGTLTVTFTETLSSTTAGTGPFAVTAAGATRPVSSVAASGSTVTLTLASAITAGQAVSVTYTDPSAGNDTNAIQDAVGNDAATFTRTVTNNSTVVSAAPDFGADTATREVAENSPAGTDVGAAVTATDVDPLTYTLGGTDAGSFQIVSTSGQIRTRSGVTYDFETKESYEVTVTADDNKDGADTITVTINLTDVEPPLAPSAPTVSVGASRLSVSWTAPSNTGPAIESYDLQYRQGSSGNFTNGPQNVTGPPAPRSRA